MWALVALCAVPAAASAAALAGGEPLTSSPYVTWVVVALLFALAEAFVVHLTLGDQAHAFSLSEVPLVLGLFFLSPLELALTQTLGVLPVLALLRRQAPVRTAFNLVQLSLVALVATAVFRALAPADPVAGRGWVAALAATMAANALSALLINSAIAASEGRWPGSPFVLDVSLGFVVANTCLGLLTVTVLVAEPAAVWLLPVLAVSLYFAYHAYDSVSQKHEKLVMLLESTRAAQSSIDVEETVRATLQRARDMLRARRAEMLLFGVAQGELALRYEIGEDGELAADEVDLQPSEGVWARVASEAQGLLLARPIGNARLREHFAARGIKDAVVAPLRRGGEVVGTLLAANRAGEFTTFGGDDVRTLETLANHVSVSLERSRLVESLRAQVEENEHQAKHDALTELPNRRLFNERIEAAIAADGGRGMAVLLLDLDRFKEVNDTLGHHNGDVLLCQVAGRLRGLIGPSGLVARLGGDEFGIVLPNTAAEAALATGEDVLGGLEEPFFIGDLALTVEGSVGVALYPQDGMDAATLLQSADVAMYAAKAGHTGVERYSFEKDDYSPERLALVADLRRALADDALSCVFQPKVDLRAGTLTGVECLVRWDHPLRGTIPPAEFVPVAEHTGLVRYLTEHVMRAAVRQWKSWSERGIDLTVAVNISARDLTDRGFPARVARVLDELGAPASSLELEITETALMAEPDLGQAALATLSGMGLHLSIDDFGTGYSSLSHLSKLPLSVIKIDRSFVRDMATRKEHLAIVRATVELAHNLGMTVVAEGIEDEATSRLLTRLGCDAGQGYLFGRPSSGDDLLHRFGAGAIPAVTLSR